MAENLHQLIEGFKRTLLLLTALWLRFRCFAGATSVAVAKQLRDTGVIRADDLVVCNLTGHGIKQPEAIRLSEHELTPIAPTLRALREQLAR